MKFTISTEVFEALPTACFGVVAVCGIDNTKAYPEVEALLNEAIATSEAMYKDTKVKEAATILPYREAFRSLGINPNKFMCSIEALLTRISKGKGFPHISPIVDLGNAVSLKYSLPIGAHDMKTVPDTLAVRAAIEGDTFIPFGDTNTEAPDVGEVVYVSGNEVRTRRWTWRQSEIGKITENTSDLLFPIDGFSDFNLEAVMSARSELAEKLVSIFGAKVKIGFVDKENPSFDTEA